MKLKFAIICNNAFTDGEGKLNIIQVFDIIFASGFPTIQPQLSVATKYDFEEDNNKEKEYKQILVFIQEKTGKELLKAEKTIKPVRDKKGGLQYVVNVIGFVFPDQGKYTVRASLNGEDFGEIASLEVKKQPN